MPVDPNKLLRWIADRESDFPQAALDGNTLMQQASGFAGDDGVPWDAVARAAARLHKRGYLDWEYVKWPNEAGEPSAELIDDQNFQRVRHITVSGLGLQALEAARAKDAATTINIINSTVGQLALGDIHSIDIFVILAAAEKALDQLEAPAAAKEEARGVIRRMRDAGASMVSSVGREVLGAAVRQALGLP